MFPTTWARPKSAVAVYTGAVLWTVTMNAAMTDADSWKMTLNGMKHARQRIVNARYVAIGEMRATAVPHVGDVSGPVKIIGALDADQLRIRFDCSQPQLVVHPDGKRTYDNIQTRFVTTSEFTAFQSSENDGRIDLGHPHHPPPDGSRPPFDIRCAGIYLWGDFSQGSPFEEVWTKLSEIRPPDESTDSDDGVRRYTWKADRRRRRLWVDESRGFTPIRFESLGDGKTRPYFESEARWKLVNKVWVPISYSIASDLPLRDKSGKRVGTSRRSYHLRCEWQAVNEGVPDKLFDYRDFGAEAGTLVADWTGGGTPVVDHVVGHTTPQVPKPARWTSGRLLVAVGGTLALLGVVVMAVRRTAM